MFDRRHLIVLILASLLDWLVGDPRAWLHPVQVMGSAITWGKDAIIMACRSPLLQRFAGILLAIAVIGGSAGAGWAIVQAGRAISPWVGETFEVVGIASCFAGRSLRDAALSVLVPLRSGDLLEARRILSWYVGRGTEHLDEPEILRAVLETVSENSTDGVIAPLFFALLGGLPAALAYKAASTLDSAIGYREAPYTYIGWCSARLEDVLSWLPCRYTVLSVALLSGRPARVWQLCCRDAPQDPSPNSGWSECAYAAALGVQLGGANTYRGIVKQKPLLGDPDRAIAPEIIHESLRLMRYSFLSLLALGGVVLATFGQSGFNPIQL